MRSYKKCKNVCVKLNKNCRPDNLDRKKYNLILSSCKKLYYS